jgi:hypothetical protein
MERGDRIPSVVLSPSYRVRKKPTGILGKNSPIVEDLVSTAGLFAGTVNWRNNGNNQGNN